MNVTRWVAALVLAWAAGCQGTPDPAPEPGPDPAVSKPDPKPADSTKPKPDPAPKQKPKPKPKPKPETPKSKPKTDRLSKGGLPAGFSLRREPDVIEARLGPAAAWRQVVSRLTTLRVDAASRGQELLASIEPGTFSITDRGGLRKTWKLPDGLEVSGTVHVVVRPDLTAQIYRPDGTQVPAADEITLVDATVDSEQHFRLIVKGGRTFRSIPKPG